MLRSSTRPAIRTMTDSELQAEVIAYRDVKHPSKIDTLRRDLILQEMGCRVAADIITSLGQKQ